MKVVDAAGDGYGLALGNGFLADAAGGLGCVRPPYVENAALRDVPDLNLFPGVVLSLAK